MPVHKVKGGYKWGKTGKTYPTKAQAEKQARAIYASGWKENKEVNKINKMKKRNVIRLTESDLHRVIKESVNQVLMEYSDEMYGKIYNTPSTDDPFYNMRLERLKSKIGRHMQDRYDITPDDVESVKDKRNYELGNKQLKGFTSMRKNGIPMIDRKGGRYDLKKPQQQPEPEKKNKSWNPFSRK